MPIPIILGAALAAKALGGFLKNKGKQKAAKEKLRSQKAQHGVVEGSRVRQNQAAQAMLAKLLGGRYAPDAAAAAGGNVARPFTGADPTKGMGWDMAGGAANAVGDAGLTYATGGMGGMGGMGGGGGGAAGPPSSDIVGGGMGGGGMPYPDPFQ